MNTGRNLFMDNRKIGFFVVTIWFVIFIFYITNIQETYQFEPSFRNHFSSNFAPPGALDLLSQNMSRTTPKYLIYLCESGLCGGWANRIYGMVMTYIIARLTGRNFRIKHTKPCDLSLFLEPHIIAWKFNKSELKGLRAQKLYLIDSKLFKKNISPLNFDALFKSDVVYLALNWDYTFELRQRSDVVDIGLNLLNVAEIYHMVFPALFKYKPEVQNEIDNCTKRKRGNRKLVCAHIRISDEDNEYKGNAEILWNWFKSFNSSDFVYYLATNRQNLKDKAKEVLSAKLIDAPGDITHVEKSNKCSGLQKTLVDHAILSRCDVLLLSSSGFGITAAYNRGTSQDLFCFRFEKIFPCKLEILHDLFVGVLGPERHV